MSADQQREKSDWKPKGTLASPDVTLWQREPALPRRRLLVTKAPITVVTTADFGSLWRQQMQEPPAAVTWPVKNRPKLLPASMTVRYWAM